MARVALHMLLIVEVENFFKKRVPERSRNSQIFSKINPVWQIVSKLKEFRSIHKDPITNSLRSVKRNASGIFS